LRVLRVVRPLRIVSKSEQLKIAINALVNSVPMLIPLIMFCGMFFFLFGIVGVQFFKGVYYDCITDNIDPKYHDLINYKYECMNYGGDWLRKDSNFDNITEAMLTMFKCSITEGWLDIL